MCNRIEAAIILSVSAVVTSAFASTEKLPQEVQGFLNENMDACRQSGGKPLKPFGKYTQTDLNGDGITDWIIDSVEFRCDGAWSIYGGSGGAPVTVFIGLPKGHAKEVFSHYAKDGFELTPEGNHQKLWYHVGGYVCGQEHFVSNAEAIRCLRPIIEDAKTGKWDFSPLSDIKIEQ